jgi:hypothetical protein
VISEKKTRVSSGQEKKNFADLNLANSYKVKPAISRISRSSKIRKEESAFSKFEQIESKFRKSRAKSKSILGK